MWMFKIFELVLVLRLQLAKSTPLSFIAQSKSKSIHVEEDLPVQVSASEMLQCKDGWLDTLVSASGI